LPLWLIYKSMCCPIHNLQQSASHGSSPQSLASKVVPFWPSFFRQRLPPLEPRTLLISKASMPRQIIRRLQLQYLDFFVFVF
jgi:hypothetical protein